MLLRRAFNLNIKNDKNDKDMRKWKLLSVSWILGNELPGL
jgi:hypothetical protein